MFYQFIIIKGPGSTVLLNIVDCRLQTVEGIAFATAPSEVY